MKLKEFNPGNTPPHQSKKAGLSPRIRVNKKAGLFGINISAAALLGIEPKHFLVAFQDEENPTDWYVEKVEKDGFLLRQKVDKASAGLWFNSCRLANEIFLSAKFKGNTGTLLVAGTPTKIGDRVLWGLLTNLLID